MLKPHRSKTDLHIGNITSRSELGTYTYPSPGGVRPHALSSIVGTVVFPPLRSDLGTHFVDFHAHTDNVNKELPSSTDLITSARSGIPGAFTYPMPNGTWGLTVYQGHPCRIGTCP